MALHPHTAAQRKRIQANRKRNIRPGGVIPVVGGTTRRQQKGITASPTASKKAVKSKRGQRKS